MDSILMRFVKNKRDCQTKGDNNRADADNPGITQTFRPHELATHYPGSLISSR